MKKNLIVASVLLVSVFVIASCENGAEPTSSELPSQTFNYNNALQYVKNHTFSLEGDVNMVFDEYGDTIGTKSNHVKSAFNESIVSFSNSYYYEISDDETISMDSTGYTVFEKEDGKAYVRTITMQNKVKDVVYTDDNEQPIIFKDYFYNPFKDLKFSDFTRSGNNVLLKTTKRDTLASKLFPQADMIYFSSGDTLSFTVKDDKFDTLTFDVSAGFLDFSVSYRYTLQFTYDVELEIPNITPYPHRDEHDDLKEALDKLQDSIRDLNYTTFVSLDGVSSFNIYETYNTIYTSAVDETGYTYGLVEENDGMYYFNYDGEKVTIDHSENYGEREYYEPSFLNFAPEFFTLYDDGKYYVEDAFVASVALLIAPFNLQYSFYNNAYTIAITLDNGEISTIEVSFFDMNYFSSGTYTLEYGAFGTTHLPFSYN